MSIYSQFPTYFAAYWTWQVRLRVLRLVGRAARRRQSVHGGQSAELRQRVLHIPSAAAGAREHRSVHRRRRADRLRGPDRIPAGYGLLPTCESGGE